MNILNKLTIKHLTMNKKRTIVTIIGIILSTALMVGIGTIASTFIGYMINKTISNVGSYHVEIKDVSPSNLKYIKNNTDILEYYQYSELGYALLEGSQNAYKPYFYIKSGDDNYLKTSDLLEGRLPKNSDEVVISAHIISNGGVKLKIGDKLNLEIGTRYLDDEVLNQFTLFSEEEEFIPKYQKEYTIVGIMARRNDEPYSCSGYTIITHQDEIEDNVNIFITYKKVSNVVNKTEKILDAMGIEREEDDFGDYYYPNVDYNNSLLAYYGESNYESINNTVISVVIIVLTLIMVGCAIVIYNSFAISVMERKKQFGLFSSIGATRKQLRKTIFYEAFIVSIIGIPIGVLFGILGIWVVVKIMNALFPLMDPKIALIVIPKYIIIPVIYMALTIIISAFIPAKRASKISPIEAIRLNDDIKIKGKSVKTGSLTRKIFGIEGELALKNMKRNKKKYRITVLSLVVSIVLFLSFSAFLEYGMRSTNDLYQVSDYDISINFDYNCKETDDSKYKEVISKLKEVSSIDKINSYYYRNLFSNDIDTHMSIRAIINEDHFSKDYYKYLNSVDINENEETYRENSWGFIILNDEEYMSYIKELKLDPKKYDGSEIRLIFPNKYNYRDRRTSKVHEGNWYDPSYDTLTFTFRSYEYRTIVVEEDKYQDNKVTLPVTYVDRAPTTSITHDFIISETMYSKIENLFPKVTYQGEYYQEVIPHVFIKANDSIKAEQDIIKALDIKEYDNDSGVTLYNATIDEQEERNTILFIGILLYGFISLVTLIGVTSVFNTINTSIALRRKEFSVLRSIGLSPKEFNKMIRYESLLYGLKALIIGLPISFVVMYLLLRAFSNIVDFKMYIIVKPLIICILGVFAITFMTMMYATSKIKRENIIDAIREENI